MDYETLQHHGILGMKWGVRRYQNEDGTYTDAGLKRHAKEQERSERKEMKRAIRDTAKERKQALKNISQLSDEELEARLKRAQKEQQLKQASREVNMSAGKSFVQNTMEQIGSKAIAAAVIGTVVYAGKKLIADDGQQSLFGNGLKMRDVMSEVLDRFGK